MRRVRSVEQLLAPDAAFHVVVVDYTISMGRIMRLVVHEGVFARHVEVIAWWCTYWRGPLEGGPWRLALEVIRDGPEPSDREVRLFDRDGGFELFCGSVKLGRSPSDRDAHDEK